MSFASTAAASVLFPLACAGLAAQSLPPSLDIVLRHATVMTAGPKGTLQDASVWIHAGKIAGVGAEVTVPSGATVIDATGKYVTPGIIDPHSHIALAGDDINEMSSPITPALRMVDAFDSRSASLYQALAGGVTTEMILHGSGNVIGGQSVIVKNKVGLQPEEMLFPNAPRSIKFASGENPKGIYGRRDQLPGTRMGTFQLMRQTFEDGRVYQNEWTAFQAKKKTDPSAIPPRRDLKLEAISDVLNRKIQVQIHCYRSDEMLTELALAKEYGYDLRALHHALEAYKVSAKIAQANVAIATFADWFGYKFEAADAIPWNAVINMRNGVRVSIKSDSSDQIRRLNQEAAKTIRYGGATEDEAIRMITINSAWIIGVQDRTGSLEIGKDADVVVWNRDPLSVYAHPEKVYIDGELFFDVSLPHYGLTKPVSQMTEASAARGEDDDEGGSR